jgi:hypothetical protein
VEAARATHTDLSQSQYNREADARWILNRGQFLEDRFCARFDITPRFWRWKEVKKSVNRTLDWLGFELVHQFRPWRLRRRLHALQERFYQFGRNSIFENVLRELGESGLKGDVVSSTASKFLESQGITRDLQKIYLEPCIKESFGLELDEAVGLHAVLASGTSRSEFPISATDGNQRFIERLIDESEANLQLGLRVVRVEPGKRRRYALTVTSSASGGNEERLEYDAVIATGNALRSLQSVNSRASQGQETTTYKTYFSTTSSLNPDAIGADSKNVPRSVLFTAEAAAGLANSYKSPIGLTSLTTWPEFYIDRTGCRFDDECDQWTNMYMAESSSPLSKNILYQLTRKDDDISWARSHPWRRNLPLVNSSAPSLGDIQVEHLLFDAGNPVIDTMEMSCRMGRNIALKLFEQRLSAIPAFGGDNL